MDFLAGSSSELVIQKTQVDGIAPFPTWNGTITSPRQSTQGLCSILRENGEIVVLQLAHDEDGMSEATCATIVKILGSPCETSFSNFCQCWSGDGSFFITSHDRVVTVYEAAINSFRRCATLQLRYDVISLDIIDCAFSSENASESELFLVCGTAFGAFVYKIHLDDEARNGDVADVPETTVTTLLPVASAYVEISICYVKVSSDGHTAAIGTFDGRLFIREWSDHDQLTTTFGIETLNQVLVAPRVTSISFSPCNTKLLVATRKGNVYVLARTLPPSTWQLHQPCEKLNKNPKVKASGDGNASTVAQTLTVWWCNIGSPLPLATGSAMFVVCSRSVNARLDMYDVSSGRLLHSLQFKRKNDLSAGRIVSSYEDQLITGICGVNLPSGRTKLVCYDADSNLLVITWPFLDVISCPCNSTMIKK